MSVFVKQSDVRNEDFDWGVIGWRCTPGTTGTKHLVVLDVSLEPGQSHDFHRHPGQEEMIIVKSGQVEQWLEDTHFWTAMSRDLAYEFGGGSQMGACGAPGDHEWCTSGISGAAFNPVWADFPAW